MIQELKHRYQFKPEVPVVKRAVQVKEQASETVLHRCSAKQVFLKNLQNPQEKIYVGVSF